MGSANERRRYHGKPSLIGRAHIQNDPCIHVYPSFSGTEEMLNIDGLMQKRRNSSALAMELRLICIKPSIWCMSKIDRYQSTAKHNKA